MENPQDQSPSASSQPNAPPPLPFLLDDLIVEILSWLPVKSLMQFRCVCKLWNSIISDPNFVKLHLHRSARNPNLILLWVIQHEDLYHFAGPCSVRSLPGNPSSFPVDEDDGFRLDNEYPLIYQVVGSCNGLVCFVGNFSPYFDDECFFYLWNPSTKLRSKYLAGSHVDPNYRVAFGYDNLSDTYKVVAFHFNIIPKDDPVNVQVKICSLSHNCWRIIPSFPVIPFDRPHPPSNNNNNAVYFNGTLNWLAALCNNSSNDYRWYDTITIAQMVIVLLDLGMETYTQLLLPCLDEAPKNEPIIGVLMDCLCFSYDCKRTHLVVWQMKEFGVEKSWTQFMKVSYQVLQIEDWNQAFHFLFPLCTSENGDVVIMVTMTEWQAILYHRRDNRVERTELPNDNLICWKSAMNYVESLVSPCCN